MTTSISLRIKFQKDSCRKLGYVLLRCPKFFARIAHKISTAATPFCSLYLPPAALANVPTSISLRKKFVVLTRTLLLYHKSFKNAIPFSKKVEKIFIRFFVFKSIPFDRENFRHSRRTPSHSFVKLNKMTPVFFPKKRQKYTLPS